MHKTFSYRCQEVVQDAPVISEFVNRWPALFTVREINEEFMRITTLPLQAKFLAQLDKYTGNLLKVFSNRGGAAGRKIKLLMDPTATSEDIDLKRDCILRCLCVYFNEDSDTLIKEYLNSSHEEAERRIAQTTIGLYVIRKDGADTVDKPVLRNLQSVAFGWAMLFGLIYTLNLSYPQEVKFTFEFFQKVLLNMDGKKLSPKVQALKIKMFQ
ncbi:uncharacterized protein LOC115582533 [Sparus aurata]|uniref:uncharacterized protein LOC115582533 n=1 Tax=Sparus aurata TaxID=8175 RepID=UPI0011C0DA9C|nr:uncharacterized protein LOC115582533 [Sparus aurata]XP_030274370.1 uncharacterized protein LOC115582533 [Sparus aurata]XP_030274371.1 uncharacterized protein LOC115582533 [Sparus aurata]